MIRLLINTVVLCVFLTGMVQPQDVDNVLARLQRKYESIRDLQASFTQTVRFGVTQATQTFQGKMWIKKGNRYRIEMEQQTIVTDGVSVWTYSDLNRQVFIDVFREDPRAITPDRVLIDVPKNYFAAIIGKEKVDGTETLVLKLTPKDKKSLVKSMKVWVNPSEWLMVKVEVLDVSDNLTTYITKEIKINSGFSDRMFQFEIPTEAEVIDLRPVPQGGMKSKPDSP